MFTREIAERVRTRRVFLAECLILDPPEQAGSKVQHGQSPSASLSAGRRSRSDRKPRVKPGQKSEGRKQDSSGIFHKLCTSTSNSPAEHALLTEVPPLSIAQSTTDESATPPVRGLMGVISIWCIAPLMQSRQVSHLLTVPRKGEHCSTWHGAIHRRDFMFCCLFGFCLAGAARDRRARSLSV